MTPSRLTKPPEKWKSVLKNSLTNGRVNSPSHLFSPTQPSLTDIHTWTCIIYSISVTNVPAFALAHMDTLFILALFIYYERTLETHKLCSAWPYGIRSIRLWSVLRVCILAKAHFIWYFSQAGMFGERLTLILRWPTVTKLYQFFWKVPRGRCMMKCTFYKTCFHLERIYKIQIDSRTLYSKVNKWASQSQGDLFPSATLNVPVAFQWPQRYAVQWHFFLSGLFTHIYLLKFIYLLFNDHLPVSQLPVRWEKQLWAKKYYDQWP